MNQVISSNSATFRPVAQPYTSTITISRIVKIALGAMFCGYLASRCSSKANFDLTVFSQKEKTLWSNFSYSMRGADPQESKIVIKQNTCPSSSAPGIHTDQSPVLQSRKKELELLNESKYTQVFEQMQNFIYYSDYDLMGESYRLRTLHLNDKEWSIAQKEGYRVFSDYISKYKSFGCNHNNIIEITATPKDSNCVDRIFSKDGSSVAHAKGTSYKVCYGDNCYLNGLVYLHEIMHVEEGYMYAQLRELMPTLKQMILTRAVALSVLDEETFSSQNFPTIKIGIREYPYSEFVSFYEKLELAHGDLAQALVSKESIEYLTGCNYNFLEMLSERDFNFLYRNLEAFTYFSQSIGLDLDSDPMFYIDNLKKIPFFARLHVLYSALDEQTLGSIQRELQFELSSDAKAFMIASYMSAKKMDKAIREITDVDLDPYKSLLGLVLNTVSFSDPMTVKVAIVNLLSCFSDKNMSQLALLKALEIQEKEYKIKALKIALEQSGNKFFELVLLALHSFDDDQDRLMLLKVVLDIRNEDQKEVLSIILRSVRKEYIEAYTMILSYGSYDVVSVLVDMLSHVSYSQKMELCDILFNRKDPISKKVLKNIVVPLEKTHSNNFVCSMTANENKKQSD